MKSFLGVILVTMCCVGCDTPAPSSDQIQASQQEAILKEGTAAIGMPAIKNFRERRLLKDIYEMRDNKTLTTFTYMFSDRGGLIFLCDSIGYGLPAATQYTSPSKVQTGYYGSSTASHYYDAVVPQADPNGLFSPASAEGTWVMCKDPKGDDVKPVYIEPRIVVSPFKLKTDYPGGPAIDIRPGR